MISKLKSSPNQKNQIAAASQAAAAIPSASSQAGNPAAFSIQTARKSKFLAKANAAIPHAQQKCETGSICNQDSQINAPQTINNVAAPTLKLSWRADEVDPITFHTEARYAQILTVESNTPWTPVSIAIVCDGGISAVKLVNGSWTNVIQSLADKDPKIGLIRFTSPTLSPRNPVHVLISSDNPIRVLDVQQAEIALQ